MRHVCSRGILAVAVLAIWPGDALAQDAGQPSFEVAIIKRTAAERLYHFQLGCAGGTFLATGVPIQMVIEWSYRLNDSQISGAPDWLNSLRNGYYIQAKTEKSLTENQCRSMVQTLLKDRFGLRTHRETKEAPVFALVRVRRSPSLREVDPGSNFDGGVRVNGAVQQALSEKEPAAGWSMSGLAQYLSGLAVVGRPVVDRTGLSGIYSFSLEFARFEQEDHASIFTALTDQLGLKLEATKAPVEVLVIDHIERPAEN
jgi:uncharacterized protein (TIGR03435 family)